MKRSVAIFGPTPQFVRWAILNSCPLRQMDDENLPDVTFRQLRGLRELSVGLIEGRVMDGICVHPDATSARPTTALGFLINEVLDAYGDKEFVAGCCTPCPANAVARDQPDTWAGCYGWLPASDDFNFEITSKHPPSPIAVTAEETSTQTSELKIDLVQLMDDVILDADQMAKADVFFKKTSPRWYGIWQASRLDSDQIDFLLCVFDEMVLRVASRSADRLQPNSDLVRFRNALRACSEHSLELHLELIPPGTSDGATWIQVAHCPACKHEMKIVQQRSQTCPACGRRGNPHGERKGKVLGLRPYVQLCGVMGESKTVEFLRRFETLSNNRK